MKLLCWGVVGVFAVGLSGGWAVAGDGKWPAVDKADREYLRGVAEETWACMAHFVQPETGLPYDTSSRADYSSVTNLGYYVACCAVASEVGLVSKADAQRRVKRVLDGYQRFRKWKGFSQSWNNVRTLEPAPHDTMISLLDSGNMVAGFVVAGQVFPELRGEVEKILGDMEWHAFYDAERGLLYGGYDLAAGKIDSGWHIGDYAGDGRMAAFWAVATEAAPPSSWNNLGRKTERHFGLTFYQPGWMGGGLFMQVQDGLFLDERCTPAGRSAADFAYAQIVYAKHLGLKAWGWSACNSPDNRYLGWGGLEVPVVTPHAAGMAAIFYPHKAADCLRALEGMGARRPWREKDGRSLKLGFRDSVNLETGAVCESYIPHLDQAMLFLGVVNALEDGLVHRLFESHPTVQRGMKLLSEYGEPVDKAWLGELVRRDRGPVVVPKSGAGVGPDRIVIDDGSGTSEAVSSLGAAISTWTRDPKDETVSVAVSRDASVRPGGCLRIDYDVDSENPAFGGVRFELDHANASGCDALELAVRGVPDNLKIELHGAGGIGVTRLTGIRPDEWSRVVVPFHRFGGMITDWSDVERFVVVFEDGTSKPKVGVLWVDDFTLVGGR